MKKLLLLLIAMVMYATAYGDVTPPVGYEAVSYERACRIMITHSLTSPAYIYALENDSADEWRFFADYAPLTSWDHFGSIHSIPRFVKAGTADNAVPVSTKVEFRHPIGDKPVFISEIYKSGIDYRPHVPKATISTEQTEVAARTYAVIINGVRDKGANPERNWNDCSFIYQVLTNHYGVPKSNIFALMSDGTNPAPDMQALSGDYVSQSLDLDLDGNDEIEYAASSENIQTIFKQLEQTLKTGDHLFIFMTGQATNQSVTRHMTSLKLLEWNAALADYEFAYLVKPIAEKGVNVNIVMGHNYSGEFIPYLQSIGCVASASTGINGESSASRSVPYNEFLYYWTSAINGATHDNIKVNADQDGDGKVSMSEAFAYANSKMEVKLTDSYTSTPRSLGEDLSFDHIPPAADIYIRDNPEDIGHEPNTTTDRTWISPDIWVRNDTSSIETHQNPEYTGHYGSHAYINVRIHNRGTQRFTGNKWLHVAWAIASTGFTNEIWQGGQCDEQGRVMGERLRALKIPEIEPGGEVLMKFEWALPSDYYDPADNTSQHFCILARIMDVFSVSQADSLQSFYNVLGRKNQAQKNVTVIYRKDASKPIPILIRNVADRAFKYSLEMIPVTKADEALYSKANIEMEMSPLIGHAWEDGGMLSNNIATTKSANGNHIIRFLAPTSKVQAVNLLAREYDYVKISFKFRLFGTKAESYTYDLIQRDESGQVIGGERFVVEAPFLKRIDPIKIGTVDKGDGHVELSVDEPGYVRYQWLDKTGNEIGTAETVTVRPTVDNTEFEARAFTEEGDVATAAVTLEPTAGIKAVSMVAPGSANVELRGAAGRDGRLVVTSMLNNAEIVSVPVAEGAGNVEIDMSHMRAGIYAVTYMEGGESIETVKFTR